MSAAPAKHGCSPLVLSLTRVDSGWHLMLTDTLGYVGRRDAPEVDITAFPRMERSGTPDDEFTGKVKKKKKKKALGAKGAGKGKDEL